MCSAPAKSQSLSAHRRASRRRLPSSRLDFRRHRPLRSAHHHGDPRVPAGDTRDRGLVRVPRCPERRHQSRRACRARAARRVRGRRRRRHRHRKADPSRCRSRWRQQRRRSRAPVSEHDARSRRAERRLADLALALGADVPFFLTGGCARVRGIGERIDPIPGWAGHELIVALPPIAVSTAWAFRAYAGGFAPTRKSQLVWRPPSISTPCSSERSRDRRAPGPSRDRAVKDGLLAAGALGRRHVG